MMNAQITIACLFAATALMNAQQLPFNVHTQDERASDGSQEIGDFSPSLQNLFKHFMKPKPPGFITGDPKAEYPNPNLSWRVEEVRIIREEVVAIVFSEGHSEVVGIYQRDDGKKRWKLIANVWGNIQEREYPDPTVTQGKADAEQPATRSESKSEDNEKPPAEPEGRSQ